MRLVRLRRLKVEDTRYHQSIVCVRWALHFEDICRGISANYSVMHYPCPSTRFECVDHGVCGRKKYCDVTASLGEE